MASVVTQVSRDYLADLIKTGTLDKGEIFYFNPKTRVGSSEYIRLYPATIATIANAMDEEACFIKVETSETDDDESSFDEGSGEEEDDG